MVTIRGKKNLGRTLSQKQNEGTGTQDSEKGKFGGCVKKYFSLTCHLTDHKLKLCLERD